MLKRSSPLRFKTPRMKNDSYFTGERRRTLLVILEKSVKGPHTFGCCGGLVGGGGGGVAERRRPSSFPFGSLRPARS